MVGIELELQCVLVVTIVYAVWSWSVYWQEDFYECVAAVFLSQVANFDGCCLEGCRKLGIQTWKLETNS